MAERVLVLSGGGARGAFQVGVLKKLTERGVSWDMIAGVSVGALNGAFLAQYRREHQKEGVVELEKFWLNIAGNKSIYKPWLCREVAALWRGGLYNSSPLTKLVTDYIHPEYLQRSGVKFMVGATCLETSDYITAYGDDPDIQQWVLASSAFPVAFQPVKIGVFHYTDGGLRNVTPFEDVIMGGHLTGDVVLASPMGRSAGDFNPKLTKNVLSVALRTANILVSEVAYEDLDELAKNEGWRSYRPGYNITGDPLRFDPDEIRAAIAYGYESA